MSIKATSLRLDQDLADELAVVARVEGRTVSDVIRAAVETHLAKRRADGGRPLKLRGRDPSGGRNRACGEVQTVGEKRARLYVARVAAREVDHGDGSQA
jgi:hypothetical protein